MTTSILRKTTGLALLAAGLVGCSSKPWDVPKLATLTLYEGLPHPMYEEKALAAEQKDKPTIKLLDDSFYRDPLDLKPGDAEALRAILNDSATFRPFEVEKKCGGFHPDYAAQWSVDGKTYTYLICFGCGEMIVAGPGGTTRYDVPLDAKNRLKALLTPYVKNRPAYQPP